MTGMTEKRTRVAVVFNHTGEDEYEKLREVDPKSLGFKPEYDIHVATVLEEYEEIVNALSKEGFDASLFNVEDRLDALIEFLRSDPPDVIFNLVEYFRDDPKLEFLIAGLYDLHAIPYTGSGPFGLALCQRKGQTKQLLLQNGVLTPRFHLLFKPDLPKRHGLHYPLIVKPAREDASMGVDRGSVVYDQEQLRLRIDRAFAEFSPPILVEEFIEGRELHVSLLGNDPVEALPILEYDFSELPGDYPRMITYAAKWEPLKEEFHRVHTVCPAALPKKLTEKIKQRSIEAFRLTNCRDYARVDLRLSKENRIYVLEVNPNPDLTEGVSFMESAEKAGLSFSGTLKRIVDMALTRSTRVRPSPGTKA